MNRHEMISLHVFIKVLDIHGRAGVRKSNSNLLELKKIKENTHQEKKQI